MVKIAMAKMAVVMFLHYARRDSCDVQVFAVLRSVNIR
jgi:hypothetical protein